MGIWKDEQIAPLKKITDFIRSQGAVPAIQLAHAGRKASTDYPGGKQLTIENGGWQTMAPSPISFSPDEIPPKQLTVSEIQMLTVKFKDAAQRALEAGFQVIEIHGAHGYLIHEFLSPLSNHRTDEYGGSFENRIRFLLQIVESVKTVWPENLPLFVRLSITEWAEGGWDVAEAVKLSAILKSMGVDLIDCSTGGNMITQNIVLRPLYQVSFAEAIRKTGILTSAVGLITTKEEIETILENKQADMVFLGRELLRNPYFVLNETDVKWPGQYMRGKQENERRK
jgi:2,4-dienoyl-CoA reductase-like NADH-dependent reductase (Old Yellow Enzyme family)